MNAVYAGSFDPFTNGHLDIVRQASKLFNNVFIVLATNADKRRGYDMTKMEVAIRRTLKNEGITGYNVESYGGFIVDYAVDHNCQYLIRGLRNATDYAYEENIAKINLELNPDIKTIYFRADNEILSSSFVREVEAHNNRLTGKYVSKEILSVMRREYEYQR